MSSRSRASRIALWAAVFALLLKAAVPAFAAMAAQMQGVPVAEVCPVYGVSLVPAHAEHAHHHHLGHEHGGKSDDHKAHELAAHGDHCALTALATLAGPDPIAWVVAPPGLSRATALPHRSEPAPDACALWVARMKHGPPVFA